MITRKDRKCCIKGCNNRFIPRSITHKVCSPECAAIVGKKVTIDNEKKVTIARKEAIKSRSDHLREAQIVFNAYIRARDAGQPCISCQRSSGAKINAGHYLAVGSHPELRFEELNNNLQCEHCNTYLSGNQLEYRKGLIAKIGIEKVEWLESKHEAKKYTIDEIKEIKAKYKQKLKDINNGHS